MDTPKTWTAVELEQHAVESLAAFVQQRLSEGTAPYCEAFETAKARVASLFEATGNLRNLTGVVLAESPELVDAARYLCGPPLSQDDINTLSAAKVSARRHIEPEAAERAVTVLKAFLDPFRCDWLDTPTAAQLTAAIDWTASLWAVEMCRTQRRTESSAAQEEKAAQLLKSSGLVPEKGLRRIRALDELPRGHFTREVMLSGAKADLAARLSDGRLLAIECKVSNSALNSVKRLNRETVGKAERWRTHYGQQVVTGAVLAGVYKVSNLVDAQRAGVFIFWDHDLAALDSFIRSNTAPEVGE